MPNSSACAPQTSGTLEPNQTGAITTPASQTEAATASRTAAARPGRIKDAASSTTVNKRADPLRRRRCPVPCRDPILAPRRRFDREPAAYQRGKASARLSALAEPLPTGPAAPDLDVRTARRRPERFEEIGLVEQRGMDRPHVNHIKTARIGSPQVGDHRPHDLCAERIVEKHDEISRRKDVLGGVDRDDERVRRAGLLQIGTGGFG